MENSFIQKYRGVNMAGYTKLLQFDKETIKKIQIRDDYTCLFCRLNYHMEKFNPNSLDFIVHDIMHFVPKSKLGLGIEENGVEGCRYHHSLLDNGNKGLRDEMLKIMEKYLKSKYPNWSKNNLIYRKYE